MSTSETNKSHHGFTAKTARLVEVLAIRNRTVQATNSSPAPRWPCLIDQFFEGRAQTTPRKERQKRPSGPIPQPVQVKKSTDVANHCSVYRSTTSEIMTRSTAVGETCAGYSGRPPWMGDGSSAEIQKGSHRARRQNGTLGR